MTFNKSTFFATVASIEAVLLVAFFWFSVRSKQPKPVIIVNPLEQALEYDSSDKRFEELVSNNPVWISYHHHIAGLRDLSILSRCAIVGRTNYVRILIKNNAS